MKTNDPDSLLNFVEWDVRNWARALNFWLAHSTKRLSECSVLEIGTNRGGLSLWLAAQGARVVCSDFKGVSEKTVERHAADGVAHLIEYQTINALNIPYTEEFDVIVFKSVLGAIGDGAREPQAQAIAEMHKALKKDGELFFAENLVASPIHMFLRRKMIEWGSRWRYVTSAEMMEFLAPFSRAELCTLGFAGVFGRREWQKSWLARSDQIIFERVVPERWKYIIAGVAQK